MGSPAASAYFDANPQTFIKAIASHLLKSNEFTVVDLTGFTDAQRAAISSYIDSLPASAQTRLIRIGF
jgi:hypothetical protein